MDLIRTYCEIAFARVAERWLNLSTNSSRPFAESYECLDINTFMDEARVHHPEISDDSLLLIYRLGIDDWSRFGLPDRSSDHGNIMRVLAFISNMMLCTEHAWPIVKFRNLFRWREVTQLLGEDLLTCAFLAFEDQDNIGIVRQFDWPSVVHNDNPNLKYLFRTKGLCELHSHLKASTNVFELSWVSLMNHVSGQEEAFKFMSKRHEPSVQSHLGSHLYELIKIASCVRWIMYTQVIRNEESEGFDFISKRHTAAELDSITWMERNSHSSNWIPDYIIQSPDSPMSVYAGERALIYHVLKHIFSTNDEEMTFNFYRYILIKSLLRKYIVQINSNIGFSNFKRYQDIKMAFLDEGYVHYTTSLPLWEAKHHNYTKIFESRIVPVTSKKKFLNEVMLLHKYTEPKGFAEVGDKRSVLLNKDWLLIFHFLKRRCEKRNAPMRDYSVRISNKKGSIPLAEVGRFMEYENLDRAMDAASSEFACRPEVFSQAFRFLRHFGFEATFHAGEDFYDIADGLRAIDEAINLLGLRTGDRIGHALALGIDARKYYESRHEITALPKQWMLDNVVWLLMKSKTLGIEMDSNTEWFLSDTYKHLVKDIGYAKAFEDDEVDTVPDIMDYWESMSLRGDAPEMYEEDGKVKKCFSPSPWTWDHYALLDTDECETIRRKNKLAKQLYFIYHNSEPIKEEGRKVKGYRLPLGYHKLITALQNAMMKDIAKRHLCIECCPSSNVRIGRLDRFENHPIFRFSPVNSTETRHSLSVTVNTDDLGIFSTSLPNEYSLLALALLKKRDYEGNHLYSSQDVYDWIGRLIDNGYKYTFINQEKYPKEKYHSREI